MDEYTLADAFLSANQDAGVYRNDKGMAAAEDWLNTHFANFIQEDDIVAMADAGVTHIRIPLPHWILEDASSSILPDEPWIVGERWAAFGRLCLWARKYNLQVWPDIHTAPGSQNGFDNSGQAKTEVGCKDWSHNPRNVQRSLDAVQAITSAIVKEGFDDVVTGFGILNEPFRDCDMRVYRTFLDKGLKIVRTTLGSDTAVYVGDMFREKMFNDGHWWLDPVKYNNTYLDSHYYHVFASNPRELSPRQHIGYTCQRFWRKAVSCCYEDGVVDGQLSTTFGSSDANSIPSKGVRRIFGEWSAAYDTLPVAKLLQLMRGIQANGTAPGLDRQLTAEEKEFMGYFVRAQMVSYESVDTGTSSGWFYWTAKMEGGMFAEWDFLRGVREGWIPKIPSPAVASESLYGTCYDIMFETPDHSHGVVHVFPDPATLPANNWQGVNIDDDVVVSHGDSLIKDDGVSHYQRNELPHEAKLHHHHRFHLTWLFMLFGVVLGLSLTRRWYNSKQHAGYTQLQGTTLNV